jgi:tripeptide aminopeptidase
MTLLDRFLRYVAVDTQSDEDATAHPSTAGQSALARMLAHEMREMGLADVEVDANGYLTATLPATEGRENEEVIGFLAHLDTSPDMSGVGVRPQVVTDYDGGDIALGDSGLLLSPREFPELLKLRGHTLITTDGTTLLGADDKAGVAEIMTAAEWLIAHPEVPHGTVRIAFTPDEEVGRGADLFDVGRFGARYAYTVDGGEEGELQYENFNAALATLTLRGRNIHPGEAFGKMVNALRLAAEFDAMLPACERPETTSGREGFYHLTSLTGTVDGARADYLLRDFEGGGLERRKRAVESAAAAICGRYGAGAATVTVRDQYRNMLQVVERHPEVVARAERAMRRAGVVPIVRPIRGGTDGARLSFMGLPCPNIFTGGANYHGRYEYCSLHSMQRAVEVIVGIARVD